MNRVRLLRRIRSRLKDDPRSLKPAERLRGGIRGIVNPLLLRATRAEYDASRTLIVAGFPRSGTTWLAEILMGIPGSAILFEPLDTRRVRAAREAGLDGENFISPDAEWPKGDLFIRNLLEGRILTRWTTSQVPVSRAWGVDRWIVKLVRANQMLGWIVTHFQIPPPILLVRHPCAVYDSWIRRGWPIRQTPPSPSLRFLNAYPELLAVVERLSTPEEYFAAIWSMQHVSPLRHMDHDAYQLCFYERLRSDGPEEIGKIFARWNLPLPAHLGSSLERPSAKASGHAQERPRGWRARVDPAVSKRILAVVEQFGIDFYRE